MKVDISSIRINDRKRKLNDDKVAELAESILLLGLLEPILVTQNGDEYTLLAGLHRIEAAKLLGWKTIEAALYQGDELERELVEIDENLINNDLTVLEQGEHIQRRNEILEAMGRRAPDHRPNKGGTMPPLKTTEDIAKEVGLSETSAHRRVQIARDIVPAVKELIRDTPIADSTTQLLELARMKPDEQLEVAKQSIDGEMNIERAKREIKRAERIENIAEIVANNKPLDGIGIFPVIYADPPWQYDFPISDSRRIENQYPTMPIEEICALPVEKIAASDGILFLWASTPFLKKGLRVLEAWGFEYRTSMVWVKPSIGPGQWVRQRHEYLLIGVRGNIPTPKGENKPDSVIESPREEHSKKPDIVYDIIERMYPELPKVELFCRNPKKGWTAWGNQI